MTKIERAFTDQQDFPFLVCQVYNGVDLSWDDTCQIERHQVNDKTEKDKTEKFHEIISFGLVSEVFDKLSGFSRPKRKSCWIRLDGWTKNTLAFCIKRSVENGRNYLQLEQSRTSKKALKYVEILKYWHSFERPAVALFGSFIKQIFMGYSAVGNWNLDRPIQGTALASDLVQWVWVKLIVEVPINPVNDNFSLPDRKIPSFASAFTRLHLVVNYIESGFVKWKSQ